MADPLELYHEAADYDLECGEFDPEGTVLLEMARAANGPVLELGCGTGQATIPLAERGIAMTGLDLVGPMLDFARHKAAGQPVEWIQADVRAFELNGRFPLIFSKGGVFQHLLTRLDQEAMLNRVKAHLTDNGRFLFDIGYKHPLKMKDSTEPEEWYIYTDSQGRRVRVIGADKYDHINQLWFQTMDYQWQGGSRKVVLTLRYFMFQEIINLLHFNGFEVLETFGDWKGGQFLAEEDFGLIILCKLHET